MTRPAPRSYKTYAEYEQCGEDSQQLIRSKYAEGTDYADVFIDEQIQAIEDSMGYFSTSMCLPANSLSDLPIH